MASKTVVRTEQRRQLPAAPAVVNKYSDRRPFGKANRSASAGFRPTANIALLGERANDAHGMGLEGKHVHLSTIERLVLLISRPPTFQHIEAFSEKRGLRNPKIDLEDPHRQTWHEAACFGRSVFDDLSCPEALAKIGPILLGKSGPPF
jgi:hypothetical protein